MAAQNILPMKVWQAGTLNNSIPANDNAIRVEVLDGPSIGVLSAQPGSPAEGDQYVLGPSPSGSQWSGLAKDTIVIYKSGTWLAFGPFVGMLKSIGSSAFRYTGPVDGWQGFSGYILPIASSSQLGGVLVGPGLTIDGSGVLSSAGLVNPMTGDGDMIFGGAGGAPTRLPPGDAGQILKLSSSKIPYWATASGGGGGLPPDLERGDMLYQGADGLVRLPAGQAGQILKATPTNPYWGYPQTLTAIPIACSDETTPLTTGLKVTFRMPHMMIHSKLRASLTTAQSGGTPLSVTVNIGGSSASVTIPNGDKSATVSPSPGIVSTVDDAEVTVTISAIGNGTAKGLKVYLIGTVTTQ